MWRCPTDGGDLGLGHLAVLGWGRIAADMRNRI